jgi:hypothetical protein
LKHSELVCALCVWDHSDHKNEVKNTNIKVLRDHTHKLLEFLELIQNDIDKLKAFCNSCLDYKVSKDAFDIMEGIKNTEVFVERNTFNQKGRERMIKFADVVSGVNRDKIV